MRCGSGDVPAVGVGAAGRGADLVAPFSCLMVGGATLEGMDAGSLGSEALGADDVGAVGT